MKRRGLAHRRENLQALATTLSQARHRQAQEIMKHFKDPPPIEPSKPPIDDGSPIPVDRDGKPVLIKRALAKCPLLGLSGRGR